jgi:site-specific DNA-adenine methylase
VAKLDNRLITSFAGSKAFIVKQLPRKFDMVWEPFGGSAAVGFNLSGVKTLIYNDANPRLMNLMRAWIQDKDKLETDILYYLEVRKLSPDRVNYLYKLTVDFNNINFRYAAITYIAMLSAYGGLTRTNRQGVSNTSLALNKFNALKTRILDKGLADRKIEVKLQKGIKKSQQGNSTLVVIDPAYYAPGKTPCYPNHDPNDPTIVLKSWEIANKITDCWVLYCGYIVPGIFEPDLSSGICISLKEQTTLGNAKVNSQANFTEFCWLRASDHFK